MIRWLVYLGVMAVIVISAAPLTSASTQTNGTAVANSADDEPSSPPKESPTLARQARAFEQATETIRADCVHGRRIICGRIMKILPDGLVVESGYPSLMRPPLSKSWLIPGTVPAERDANLIEGNEPGCVCVGRVFLTSLPRSRVAKPKLYDYVVIQAYPIGQYTYTSVGSIERTIRRFSATLATAVKVNRSAAGIQPPAIVPENK
jgi:hypothetical protein